MRKNKKEDIKAKERYKAYKRNKYGKKRIIIPICLMACALALILVYFTRNNQEEEIVIDYQEGELVIEKSTGDSASSGSDTNTSAESLEENQESQIEETVEAYLESMNLEARVGQLFITSPEELTGVGIVVQAGETTKQMLKEYAVGGLLFSEQNFEVVDQMKLMLTSIEVYTSTPIFLIMDEAGTTRVTNTQNSLSDVGFDMQYVEGELYLVNQEETMLVSESLQVVVVENQDVIEAIQEGGELFIVEDDFQDIYEMVLAAARSGELEESLIEERVRAILTYKIEYGI